VVFGIGGFLKEMRKKQNEALIPSIAECYPLKFVIIWIQPGIEIPVSQLGKILSQPGNHVADANTCNIS